MWDNPWNEGGREPRLGRLHILKGTSKENPR